MKNRFNRIISLLLVMVMLFSLSLTSCKRNNQGNNEENEGNGSNNGGWQMPEDEYTIPKEEGYNQITFYWSHPGVYTQHGVY